MLSCANLAAIARRWSGDNATVFSTVEVPMSKPKAPSWRHHYVPKFHLNGFTKADGELYVFDKVLDRLKPRSVSPTSHFFEPNRNTVAHPGIDPDVVERYYGQYDSTVAGVFQRLREDPPPVVDLRMIQDLKCYISVLFWRLPESEKYLDGILPKLGFDKLGIRLLHPETREEIQWPEFEQIVLKDPDFRKGIRFLSVPLATFDLFVQQYDAVNWGLYRAPSGKGGNPHICSDNPIVFEKLADAFEFKCHIAFPANSDCLVFYSPIGKRPDRLDQDTRLDLDCVLFRQAHRYVCGPDGSYLESLAKLCAAEGTGLAIEQQKERLFRRFRELSEAYPAPTS